MDRSSIKELFAIDYFKSMNALVVMITFIIIPMQTFFDSLFGVFVFCVCANVISVAGFIKYIARLPVLSIFSFVFLYWHHFVIAF